MFKKTKICTGVLVALGGSLALGGLPAFAQSGDRVEITGSRIKTIETEGASLVITLDAEAIRVEAVRNVESLLNNLPQVFADYGAQVANGATGTATVNLRNLGAERTLVLINGRRVPAGSPRFVAADLNQIPVSLVRRVEILTGGASAVYGADAVAGVVNFIMNDRFEGVEVELNHQFFNHKQKGKSEIVSAQDARNISRPGNITSDGEVTDFGITLGGNFAGSKGNATAYFGYKKEAALNQSERDFSACALSPAGSAFRCGGSSTSFPGRFITDLGNFTVADANGGTRAWTAANDLYNYAPLNYFQRPSERYTASTFARYDITEAARVYLEASFHDDHTVAQIAPSGLFGFDASGSNAIRWENPLLSNAWRDALGMTGPGDTAEALILRRNVEGGGRQDDIRHTSYRFVTGVKGDIGAFSYDAFAQMGKVVYQETYKNDFSIVRSARALDVIADANGNPVCRSAADGSDPGCVPYNIWSLGKITPEALAYLQMPGFQKGYTSQSVVGGSVSVDLGAYGVKLPTAKEGLGLVVGAERRTEKLDLSTDAAFTSGDLAGQGGPTISVGGSYSVRDLFTELRVPLLQGMPMADSLNLSASYRNSDYSTGAKSNTWGLGLEYAPISMVKLRGSVQRAVRAPNVIDLFSAQSLGLYNMNEDPCAGDTPSATLQECARTGVTAAQYGSIIDSAANQYNALYGGNPNLKPETAKSVSFGVVLQPTKDLDVTVDFFSIKLEDGIGAIGADLTLDQCLQTGSAVFCDKIQRDSRGTLWATPAARIEATNANLSKTETEGIDFGVNYRAKLGGMGGLDVSMTGTALRKFLAEPVPGLGTYDCAGLWGNGSCGTPMPKWRHKVRTTWVSPWGVDLALTWRHIGKVSEEVTSSNPLLSGTVNPVQSEFSAMNYFDVSAKYDITKNLALRLAVNNLFDKDPPVANTGAPFGNGNTFPVVYDALGRKIALSLTAKF
ncbi:MAG: TonB-dependent receptor [Burkholderiaceae bacterium]|nr:TonB-dependent receptor [Burkholderiaceae bacterium]